MNGFWGSFKSTLDSKGRINFPAKFRKNLKADDEDTLILIRGKEQCIAGYPLTSWEEKISLIRNKVDTDREFAVVSRRLMFQASEQKIDKQGRLNLTAELIDYADLNGEVMVVGYQNKIEIWNRLRYEEFVQATELDYLNITQDLDI